MSNRPKEVEGLRVGEAMLKPIQCRLFYCVDHDGMNGASSHRASVIVAKDEVHARELLDKALTSISLLPFRRKRYILTEIPLDRWTAKVLADGSM